MENTIIFLHILQTLRLFFSLQFQLIHKIKDTLILQFSFIFSGLLGTLCTDVISALFVKKAVYSAVRVLSVLYLFSQFSEYPQIYSLKYE